jgi:hypothetical protein
MAVSFDDSCKMRDAIENSLNTYDTISLNTTMVDVDTRQSKRDYFFLFLFFSFFPVKCE